MVRVALLCITCVVSTVAGIATHGAEKAFHSPGEPRANANNSELALARSRPHHSDAAVTRVDQRAAGVAAPARTLVRKVQSSSITQSGGLAPTDSVAGVSASAVEHRLDSGALAEFYANTRGGAAEIDGMELPEIGATPLASVSEAGFASKGAYAAVQFSPTLRTCDASGMTFDSSGVPVPAQPPGSRELDNMIAVLEVKKVFDELNVPLILLNSLVLGWRRNCMIVPDDSRVSLGTFGSWLVSTGLEKVESVVSSHGHFLDTTSCTGGPGKAGCVLRVQVRGIRDQGTQQLVGLPTVDISVLFPPPCPWKAASVAARFQLCDHHVCGERCERCGLAYAWHDDAGAQSKRFVPCPVPLRQFELVAWMNVSFWAPANVDEYLGAEYGESARSGNPARDEKRVAEYFREAAKEAEDEANGAWAAHVLTARGSCRAYLSKQVYQSAYDSSVSGVPSGPEVAALQLTAERQHRDRIALSANSEAVFAGPRLRAAMDMDVEPTASPLAESVDELESAAVPLCRYFLSGCMLIWAVVVSWLISKALRQRYENCGRSLNLRPPADDEGADIGGSRWLPAWIQTWAAAGAWACLAAALPFVQHKAETTHSSLLSAVLLAWLLRSLFGFISLCVSGEHSSSLAALGPRSNEHSDVVPLFMWTLLPGGCFAVADLLSFLALQTLDPATFQIALLARLPLWHLRSPVSTAGALPQDGVKAAATERKRTSWASCIALMALAFAVLAKCTDVLLEGSYALGSRRGLLLVSLQLGLQATGVVATQELRARNDLMEKHGSEFLELCTDVQGWLLLSAASIMSRCMLGGETLGELLGGSIWQGCLEDPWLTAAVLAVAACGSRAALRRQSSAHELGGGCAAPVCLWSAVVAFVWPFPGCPRPAVVAVQACILAALSSTLLGLDDSLASSGHQEHGSGKDDGAASPED